MYRAIGCVVGTLIGLLPGPWPLATISLLLPLTYSIPAGRLIMLAGIYYGAQYGDSVSAITMKIPHASSIVACIDGYQMTLKGKTGLALFTAGVSSFIGGTVAIVVLSWLAPQLGEVALLFGAADYCAFDAARLLLRQHRHHRQFASMAWPCASSVCCSGRSAPTSSPASCATPSTCLAVRRRRPGRIALGCFGIAEITKNLDERASARPSTARSS